MNDLKHRKGMYVERILNARIGVRNIHYVIVEGDMYHYVYFNETDNTYYNRSRYIKDLELTSQW